MSTPIATPPGKHGYRTRDESIRPIVEQDAMILENMRLVGYVWRKKRRNPSLSGITYDDAEGAGYLGLIRAVEKYREDWPYAFSTYACKCIYSKMQDAALVHRFAIAIPKSVHFNDRHSKPYLREAAEKVVSLLMIDDFDPDDNKWEPPCTDDILRHVCIAEELQLVWRLLRRVPREYREPFLLHHLDGLTLRQIGERMGISRQAVEQRVERARRWLDRLRRMKGAKRKGVGR